MYEASTAHLSEACHGEREEGRQIAIAKAQCLGIRSQLASLKALLSFLEGMGRKHLKLESRKAKLEKEEEFVERHTCHLIAVDDRRLRQNLRQIAGR